MEEFRDDIAELKERVDNANANVERILSAMIGSDITKDGGLVGKVNSIEKKIDHIDNRVTSLEKKEDKRTTQYITLIAIGSLIGIAIQYTLQILSLFKK